MPIDRPDDIEPTLGPGPTDERAGASSVTRFGTAIGAGALTSVVASVPAALRIVGRPSPELLLVLAVLAALALPAGVVAAGVMRRARVGAKLLAFDRADEVITGVLFWATAELALAAVFAALLRKHTHHHGLAGVTFAMFAAASGVVLALLVARAIRILGRLSRSSIRVAALVATLAAFVLLATASRHAAHIEGSTVPAVLVDGLAFAVAAAAASSPRAADRRLFAIAGVVAASVVAALGFVLLRRDASILASFATRAPLHEAMVALFRR